MTLAEMLQVDEPALRKGLPLKTLILNPRTTLKHAGR